MIRIVKVISCLLVSVSVLFGGAFASLADSRVTYEGSAGDFVFEPGSKYSPTDLFSDFKNVMPGDSITQKITVDNKAEKNVKIKLYMRSLGAEKGSEEFLSKLHLRIEQNGDSALFDAPASESAQLSDWVCLGTVYSGGKIDLDVTLDVPITLENHFQDAVGYLDWQFRVEELPVSPDDPKAPQTGDITGVVLFFLVISVSSAAFTAIVAFRRRRKDN